MKTDFAFKYVFISRFQKNKTFGAGAYIFFLFYDLKLPMYPGGSVFPGVLFNFFFFSKWLGSKPWQPGGSITPRDEKALKNRLVWCEGPCWSLQLYEKREATRLSCKCHGLFSNTKKCLLTTTGIWSPGVLCLSVSSTLPPCGHGPSLHMLRRSWKDCCWWSQSVGEWRREQDGLCSSSLSSQDNTTEAAVAMWHCRLL